MNGIPPRRRSRVPGIASLVLFALVAASLLFGTYLIFSTVRAERAEREQVARTNLTLDALRDIGVAAINAETGQRGYLLTLDRRYLASYQLGAATYPEAARRLHAALDPHATPRQRELVRQAEALADSKFAEMAESVALVEDGAVLDARSRLLSDEGQDLMVRLRATLHELEASEDERLTRAAALSARLEGRMLPLLGWLVAGIVLTLALGLWLVARTARAEAAAANAAALAEARDRADLLARELNHRVKNIFAVIVAIVQLSGKGEPAAKPVIEKISRRIKALVTAHEVTQGQGAVDRPTIELRELVETALAPYRARPEQLDIAGPEVPLRPKVAMPLGLVLHELATNAVKYGALGKDGTLCVHWHREEDRVHLTWREEGEPREGPAPKDGFGGLLLKSSARQLGGKIERHFHSCGIAVTMDLAAD